MGRAATDAEITVHGSNIETAPQPLTHKQAERLCRQCVDATTPPETTSLAETGNGGLVRLAKLNTDEELLFLACAEPDDRLGASSVLVYAQGIDHIPDTRGKHPVVQAAAVSWGDDGLVIDRLPSRSEEWQYALDAVLRAAGQGTTVAAVGVDQHRHSIELASALIHWHDSTTLQGGGC